MNILVVKLSSIGDIVFGTPCLDALRKHWPDARITVAVNRQFASLYEENPVVDDLRIRETTRKIRRLKTLRQAAWSGIVHRHPRFDLALDLQGNFHSAAWTYCSGARRMAGLGEERRFWEFSLPVDFSLHAVDQCAAVLERIGVPVADRRPRLFVSEQDDAHLLDFLRRRGLPESGYIVVHPFTAWRSKEWPIERYASVLRSLIANRGHDIRVLVNGSSSEASRAEALSAMVASPQIVSVAGELTLGESLALWSRARLFLGGDTGALHASAAFGVQSIALFGPTWPEVTGPIGSRHRVIQARRPPSHNAYREAGAERYMMEISEAEVLDALAELQP